MKHLPKRTRHYNPLTALGPGLITGAADDDPSGIATYSQAGAQFGFQMLWTMVFTYPLQGVFQSVCARIGRVTGKGLAANIKTAFPPWVLLSVVALVLFANILNVSSDVAAMGEAAALFVPGQSHLLTIGFALLTLGLLIFVPYHRYVWFLKWLTLSLFAYVATALWVKVPWGQVAFDTFIPSFSWQTDYIVTIVAVLGTTITPYCFFWQSSQEAEDERVDPNAHTLIAAPEEAQAQISRIRFDTYLGMGLSNLISFFIIVTAAATLHSHGVANIETSAQAAEALRPIAGVFTFVIFAAGIIGIGLLAVPVLAGSAAYALGEALNWPTGLDRRPLDAKAFYGTIAVATVIGILINFVDLDPIKALFWSAVLNGVVAVPLMVVIMVMAMQPKIMGSFVLPRPLWAMGWLCTAVMAVAVTIMFVTL